ncbi:hypothetical protein M5K25_021079 [Dendrobium thyrsiflorum]|uniref:Uncharacterized protein n=1 Tax=Dendrobium thyrsiflorum TaxID=117978 RepID=A0ABD0UIJ0_DENTH
MSIVLDDMRIVRDDMRIDDFGSSWTMWSGRRFSEYEFIIVLNRLDDQITFFELIVQDDRLSSEYVNIVLGSLPSSGSGERGYRFSAGEGRGCLCRKVGRNSCSLPEEEEVAFAERLEGTAVLCRRRKRLPLPKVSDKLSWRLLRKVLHHRIMILCHHKEGEKGCVWFFAITMRVRKDGSGSLPSPRGEKGRSWFFTITRRVRKDELVRCHHLEGVKDDGSLLYRNWVSHPSFEMFHAAFYDGSEDRGSSKTGLEMVGGGIRRDDAAPGISSKNVFAALETLKKKKKSSVKDRKVPSKSKELLKTQEKEPEPSQVFWIHTPLNKSWADVDDDDDDYYKSAPVLPGWGAAGQQQEKDVGVPAEETTTLPQLTPDWYKNI